MDKDGEIIKGPWAESDDVPAWLQKKLDEENEKKLNEDTVKGNAEEQIQQLKEQAEQLRKATKEELSDDLPDQIDENENFSCNACGYTTDASKVISMNMGIPVIICPYCLTLQLPRKIFDDLKKQIKSNIAIPKI